MMDELTPPRPSSGLPLAEINPDSGALNALESELLKINAGCGAHHRIEGWVNVDCSPEVDPDQVANLCLRWPWADNSIDEMAFNHSLEHMGAWETVFREMYRCCVDGAIINIVAPHVRNDDFVNDPTHVLRVTVEFLSLLSRKVCAQMRERGAANTPFADMIGVDFEITAMSYILEPRYQPLASDPAIQDMIRDRNNVVKEVRVTLKVVKP